MTREELWILNEDRLAELAYRAIHYKSMKREEFVVVCIDVDDPTWKFLVDTLMPEEDWQKYRDVGAHPIARGSVMRENLEEDFKLMMPEIGKAFDINFSGNLVMALVMAEGGIDVYTVEPKCEEFN